MGLAKELRSRRNLSAREIEVEAWADSDGQPFALYCYPLTCFDMNEMQKKHPKFMEGMTLGAMVDLIVLKACDKSGERIFTSAEDKHDLMGEESAVISDIAARMFASVQSVEEHEKD
jgi:hypothetical protein